MMLSLKQFPLYLLAASLTLSAGTALAERPDWAGRGGKDHQERRGDDRDDDRRESRRDHRDDDRYERRGDVRSGPQVQINIGGYFGDRQRDGVRDYYREEYRSGGHCPPGLAKKHNGCMPPGQAKAWKRGYALPPDVVYYPVPSSVSVRLGTPPAGYKYVRVAADILLIAVGTGMVIDAVEDLMRM